MLFGGVLPGWLIGWVGFFRVENTFVEIMDIYMLGCIVFLASVTCLHLVNRLTCLYCFFL